MGVERVLTYDHEEKERERVEGEEVSSRDIVYYILFLRGVPSGHWTVFFAQLAEENLQARGPRFIAERGKFEKSSYENQLPIT